MGFVFGKYCIYLQFADGEKAFLMTKRGDHIMTTSSAGNAEKFMTQSGAENYFYNNDVAHGTNSNFSRVVGAWVYSDGKYFRMG